MRFLELLAPARNKDIGIAAIDCGADAVYIAGPDFGARKAAGNSVDDIKELCSYAHRYGARVFVTFNTLFRDDEEQEVHRQMLEAQDAGADAFIIRDERILAWGDLSIPMHASTQCAIRDVSRARHFESLGCARIILERQLSLETIREICSSVNCEVEFFVHGALCVGYSGECRLSEHIDGRSADRGECIQACRSLYDLVDSNGRVLLRNKAILSLKDYNLKQRICELAEAGVNSFKIEGRLKNASYVKNIVRDYSIALDTLVEKYPDLYRRASFGRVEGGFTPDADRTFNRGYTDLWLDGRRGKWSSMDTPKSVGEAVGTVSRIRREDRHTMSFTIKPSKAGLTLHNGDGFSFPTADGITGFRGDVCRGLEVTCKYLPDLREGAPLFRNINSSFEKILEAQACHRIVPVELKASIKDRYSIDIVALSQDGRSVSHTCESAITAENRERAESMLREQLSKKSGIYSFSLSQLEIYTADGSLPLLSSSAINGMRRAIAEELDGMACNTVPLATGQGRMNVTPVIEHRDTDKFLLKTKYCIRYELGMCPRRQGAKDTGKLFIVNNGRRFALEFDCVSCEMSVTQA